MSKDPQFKKTEEMIEYEQEVGKLAIFRGEVTKDFLKWKKKKEKEDVKQEKIDELAESRKARKSMKREIEADEKNIEIDYDHLITVENLHKTYLLGTTAVAALRGVDLHIDKGDFVDIMGPSGSGKTTLLNLLGGLDTPTRGKIFLEGRNISMLSDNELADIRRERIGFVFQFYNLLPQMTGVENVMVPLHFSGKLSRRGKRKRAMDLLRLVGLDERAHHTPSELSGGEQQRVAIARAFANDPAICVLDEPTGDLDSKTGIMILELLKELNQRGATFIAVSHDAAVAEPASKVLHMKDGKLVKEGKIAGLKSIQDVKRQKDEQINKEKAKNKIWKYLFSHQGQQEFSIADLKGAVPETIVAGLPMHFNDVVTELLNENNLPGKLKGEKVVFD